MPPPPATARALRAAKPPLSHDRVRAWVQEDIADVREAQAQDIRQMQNSINTKEAGSKIVTANGKAKDLRRAALDALAAGDPEAVKIAILAMGEHQDVVDTEGANVCTLADQSLAIEGEDVRRNRGMVHKNDIKIAHLRDHRQPDNWRPQGPNGDGPGAA